MFFFLFSFIAISSTKHAHLISTSTKLSHTLFLFSCGTSATCSSIAAADEASQFIDCKKSFVKLFTFFVYEVYTLSLWGQYSNVTLLWGMKNDPRDYEIHSQKFCISGIMLIKSGWLAVDYEIYAPFDSQMNMKHKNIPLFWNNLRTSFSTKVILSRK